MSVTRSPHRALLTGLATAALALTSVVPAVAVEDDPERVPLPPNQVEETESTGDVDIEYDPYIPSATGGMPWAPLEVELTQPDGATFQATPWGDGALNGYETLDGFSLARDDAGEWRYADGRTPSGHLRASNRRPDRGGPPPGAGPHQRPSAETADPEFTITYEGDSFESPPEGGHSGTEDLLVLLVEFDQGLDSVEDTGDQFSAGDYSGSSAEAFWSKYFFGTGTGSVNDFYDEASYGNLTFSPAAETHGTTNDGVVGFLKLDENHGGVPNRQIAKDAIAAADGFIDFSAFDGDDGVVDNTELHIVVVVAGYETAFGGASAACTPHTQAHQAPWPVGTEPKVESGAVTLEYGYVMLGEAHCKNNGAVTQVTTIGVGAHELGHDIGLPDLYDTDSSSLGLGVWSIMAGGGWNALSGQPSGSSPAHFTAWEKTYQGWLAPHVASGSADVTVDPLDAAGAANPQAVQLRTNPNGSDWEFSSKSGRGEYFLVENRQRSGFDAALPGCGLLVTHVDETQTYRNSANANEWHPLIAVEQADGAQGLQNSAGSDDGDPFPGASRATVFNATSANGTVGSDAGLPYSLLYSGLASGVSMTLAGDTEDCGTPSAMTGTFAVNSTSQVCVPDDAEDDDSPATAPGILNWRVYDRALCSGDVGDYAAVDVLPGSILDAEIWFDSDIGNLELSIVDEGGTSLVAGAPTADGALASHTNTGAITETVYLEVVGATGSDQNTYQLHAGPVAVCGPDDEHEPNDFVSLSAPTMEPGAPRTGVLCDAADADTFQFQAPRGASVDVMADFSRQASRPHMGLYRQDPDTGSFAFVGSDYGSVDHLAVSYVPSPPDVFAFDTYVVALSIPPTAAGYPPYLHDNVYELNVDAGTAPACPPDDQYEPNDWLEQATPIFNGITVDAVACGSEDWFTVPALGEDGNSLDVLLEFAHADGDLTLELYDDQGTPLDSSNTATDDETISYVPPAGTTDWYAVRVFNASGVPYRLTGTSGYCPPDDPTESTNDSPTTAPPLPTGSRLYGAMCGFFDTFDFFNLGNFPAGDTILGTMDYPEVYAGTEAVLALRNTRLGTWVGTRTFSSSGSVNQQQIVYQVPASEAGDEFLLTVQALNGQDVWWELGASVRSPNISVEPQAELVTGALWEESVDVTVDVDDPANGAGTDATLAATPDAEGSFSADFSTSLDIEPGFVVTASDGAKTTIHTVTELAVTTIDVATDTVAGTTNNSGAEILVEVTPDGAPSPPTTPTTADGNGDWIETLSFDLRETDEVGAAELDSDGNATRVGPSAERSRAPGDFDGDGTTDVAVFRPSTGSWLVHGQFTRRYGAEGDIPVPGDFDGDGTTDVAVFRPSTGSWLVHGQFTRRYGAEGDIPVPGDYDGDGTTDVAVFRPSTGSWLVHGQFTRRYGAEGDIPVPGDFDGDGTTDVAVFRPSTGSWLVHGQFTRRYGAEGDIPVPGDFDGDGTTDVAVFRPSTGSWLVHGQFTRRYGAEGDIPVPGDFDGDGTTDVAVFRPSTGSWLVHGQFTRRYGAEGDIPVPSRLQQVTQS